MKNPLRKRLLREFRSEFGKYLVIFILLVATIGFVSGFLVADNSMIVAYEESFEKYNIEDGNFTLAKEVNRAQRKSISEAGVTLYENYYIEKELTNDTTLRIFQNRTEVNKVCLMEGSMPEEADEIAIDRMYAENNDIQVGDVLVIEGNESEEDESEKKKTEEYVWKVTGLVALSDYSCLFQNNSDSMFDSVKFGVAVVTEEAFATFDEDLLTYSYSWKYDQSPIDEEEEKEMAEDLMEVIVAETKLESFVPLYQNQAIQFTGEDMGSDRVMMMALLYIVIAIMAFVFGITTSNTILKEAAVIGTLRASGYTKAELVRHYMSMPVLVTIFGAIVGNVLGYTMLKDVCVGMYYGSYSLPTYVTVWNMDAFFQTTVIPVILMAVINYVVLRYKLSLPPLKFLRRDIGGIGGTKQKRAFPLPVRIPFFGRFRLRVIFQNSSNYVILFVGVIFANLLLMFGLLFPSVLEHYQETMPENLLCQYQYILSVPMSAMNENRKLESLLSMLRFQKAVETENTDAEKFSIYTLVTPEDGDYGSEEVLLYGIVPESRYVIFDVPEETVAISSAYAEKYYVDIGDQVTLEEEYEDEEYTFTVGGIYDYEGAIAIFMDQEMLNTTFNLGDDYFCGYLSDTEITDIDEQYIGSVIDLEALTKISRQLQVSMGEMMNLVAAFALLIFLVVMYLLSKIIIEKNTQSISMAKILGYTNGEISRLYILPTTFAVAVFILLSLPLEYEIMVFLFREIMLSMITGWIPLYMDSLIYVKIFAMGMTTYVVVAVLEYRRICLVPMDEALKNVE